MLNLSEFKILLKEQSEHYYRFTVECKEKPMFCGQCMWTAEPEKENENKKNKKENKIEFKVHSVKKRTVTDIDAHGKAVKIVINHKRYKCPFCGKTFYEHLESVGRNDKG